MQPIDAVRLMSAFGTAEPGFATLMLSGIINAACGGGPSSAVHDFLPGGARLLQFCHPVDQRQVAGAL